MDAKDKRNEKKTRTGKCVLKQNENFCLIDLSICLDDPSISEMEHNRDEDEGDEKCEDTPKEVENEDMNEDDLPIALRKESSTALNILPKDMSLTLS